MPSRRRVHLTDWFLTQGFQLAGATEFASVAMAVRGAATGDRSHLRDAALLGAVALYVNLPAFVATADAARRRGLGLGGTNPCVDDYLARRDASDMYGRPSPARATRLCRYIITEIWGTELHLLFLLLSTIAAAAAVTTTTMMTMATTATTELIILNMHNTTRQRTTIKTDIQTMSLFGCLFLS